MLGEQSKSGPVFTRVGVLTTMRIPNERKNEEFTEGGREELWSFGIRRV